MDKVSSFDEFNDEESGKDARADLVHATETIDLESIVTTVETTSGSFVLSGIEATSFGTLLHAIPLPVLLIDQSLRVSFANHGVKKIAADYRSIESRPFDSLFPNSVAASVNKSHVEHVFSSRKPTVSEAVIQIDGSRIWGRLHYRAVKVGKDRFILVLIEDLTHERRKILLNKVHEDQLRQARNELKNRNERLKKEIALHKRTADALRESQAKYRAIVEGFDGIIYICSAAYDVEFINRRLMEKLGRYPIGEKCYRAIYNQDEVCSWCLSERVLQTIRGEVFDPNDSRWYHSVETPLAHKDGSLSKLVMLHDITETKIAEQALRRTERLTAVGELASGVAHNFNNLLQIVMTGAQSALADVESGELAGIQAKLKQIIESAHFGAETVKSIQEFAQIRPTEQRTEKGEIFDLADTVAKAVEMSRPWWKTRPEKEGIRITLGSRLDPGCFVQARESELFQVVINLIKNAADALPEGGEINIATQVSGAEAILTVADNGVSIAKDDLGKVFEPFWTTKGFPSTGMGLASSLGIVGRCGGKIAVESAPGTGSRFTVRLPLATRPPESAAPAPDDDVTGLHILVVDDMEPVLSVLNDGLSSFGHQVLMASSGSQALALFRENRVDVIICDLAMPEMNGWEVAKAVRAVCQERGTPKPPFILLTGWGGQVADTEALTESGVDTVIEKPIDLGRLQATISELASTAIAAQPV
jgi:two-component system, cell cycle sensor histidine kinase and response regulator CckA